MYFPPVRTLKRFAPARRRSSAGARLSPSLYLSYPVSCTPSTDCARRRDALQKYVSTAPTWCKVRRCLPSSSAWALSLSRASGRDRERDGWQIRRRANLSLGLLRGASQGYSRGGGERAHIVGHGPDVEPTAENILDVDDDGDVLIGPDVRVPVKHELCLEGPGGESEQIPGKRTSSA